LFQFDFRRALGTGRFGDFLREASDGQFSFWDLQLRSFPSHRCLHGCGPVQKEEDASGNLAQPDSIGNYCASDRVRPSQLDPNLAEDLQLRGAYNLQC